MKYIALYLIRFLCGVIQMQSVRGSLSSRIQAMSSEPPFRSITKWGTDNPSPMTAAERNATSVKYSVIRQLVKGFVLQDIDQS